MASKRTLYLDQNSKFSVDITINDDDGTPLDLTDYLIESQMRREYSSSQYVDITTNIVSAEDGIINLSLTSAVTGALTPGRYVYDVYIYEPLTSSSSGGGEPERILEGTAFVSPTVTR